MQIGLTIQDLDLLTVGTIIDLFIEKQNDEQPQEPPATLADQADFNNF